MTQIDSHDTTSSSPAGERPSTALRMHHHAYVVKDQEITRQFYEDLLGLPLVATWCEKGRLGGPDRPEYEYCHTFFGLEDGSALAFFQLESDELYDEFVAARSSHLNHIALAVSADAFDQLVQKIENAGLNLRVVDHGYCKSMYVSDPDGLLVEFTCDPPNADAINALRRADAHSELERWLSGDRTVNNILR